MTIGQVAKDSGVGVDTIRFYEREGLLPRPPRTPSGYRTYPADTPRRLHFIKRARDLGFTLQEIVDLLNLSDEGQGEAALVRDRALAKLADLDRRIRDLERMRSTLQHLVHCCDGRLPLAGCPILEALDGSV